MKKKLVFPVAVATILVIAATFTFFYIEKNKFSNVSDLSLHIIDGDKLKLSSLKGKPVLVTFWATTCSTCVKEIPHLAKLYQELGNDIFEIVAIAMPYDPPNLVVSMAEKTNIPYPVALDIQGDAVKAFGDVLVTPTSFLIDTQGNIVEEHKGELDIQAFKQKVKKLHKTTVS
jgi:thiol-disulfide isomerase/thioredoxin